MSKRKLRLRIKDLSTGYLELRREVTALREENIMLKLKKYDERGILERIKDFFRRGDEV